MLNCIRKNYSRRRNGGHWGHVPLKDFDMNEEVSFLFQENVPFSSGKNALEVSCPQA